MLRVISVNPTTYDLTLVGDQGTNWAIEVAVFEDTNNTVPKNLTGYTAEGWYKRTAVDSNKLITFTCTVLPYHAVSNPNTNKVRVSAVPSQTAGLKILEGWVVIKIVSPTDTQWIAWGHLTINPE